MLRAVLICFFSLLFELPVLANDTLSSREKLIAELASYIENNYMTPEDYIISKFTQHDVVFIGEEHLIKHDAELISNLIPLLYESGVHYLGTEFARREDQPLIDSLLEGTSFNQNSAQKITFLGGCDWGFQEYVDIFKTAWELNHNLPENTPKFRILGLNDSPDWSIIKKPGDWENDTIRKKVWRGGGEDLWAKMILDEVIAKGEKALIYSGSHHAFTEYKQPIFDEEKQAFIRFEDRRMGNYVFNEIGKWAITIYLHAPWYNAEGYDKPKVFAADGIIDELMSGMDAKYRRVGFDTKGTPFEKVTGETSIYKYGYANFTLATFCDGYVFQKPLLEYQGVTPIPNFINESNIKYARQQSDDPEFRNISIDDFNRSIASNAAIEPKIIHYLEARNAYLKGEYEKAIQLYLEGLTYLGTDDELKATTFYRVSRCYSLLGKAKEAFEYLDRSIKFGYSDYEQMKKDTDFDFLRKSDPERFKKIVARTQKTARQKKSP